MEPRPRRIALGALARRAYHEAGHGVVALELGALVGAASMRSDADGVAGGSSVIDEPWWKGESTLPEDLPRSAMVSLGGIAAEGVVDAWGRLGSCDVEAHIETGVSLAIGLWSHGHGGGSVPDFVRAAQCIPDDQTAGGEGWLKCRAIEAGRILLSQWGRVEDLRRALMRCRAGGYLTADELAALLGGTVEMSERIGQPVCRGKR